MSRYKRFTFLCNRNERLMIALLANQLQRSQSDAIRFIIRQAIKGFGFDDKLQNMKKKHEVQHDR